MVFPTVFFTLLARCSLVNLKLSKLVLCLSYVFKWFYHVCTENTIYSIRLFVFKITGTKIIIDQTGDYSIIIELIFVTMLC